jgi:hypothetical protein
MFAQEKPTYIALLYVENSKVKVYMYFERFFTGFAIHSNFINMGKNA